ncbi:MAG TPA: hypothetical protein VJX16_04570 [Terriglobales bacterium]|nr:hypothetical protein [Terriglobales bacterium]
MTRRLSAFAGMESLVKVLVPPQSRGLPTWFVVPDELSAVVREVAEKLARGGDAHLTAAYREMASDEAREREAEKWAEGLIGDASPQR